MRWRSGRQVNYFDRNGGRINKLYDIFFAEVLNGPDGGRIGFTEIMLRIAVRVFPDFRSVHPVRLRREHSIQGLPVVTDALLCQNYLPGIDSVGGQVFQSGQQLIPGRRVLLGDQQQFMFAERKAGGSDGFFQLLRGKQIGDDGLVQRATLLR